MMDNAVKPALTGLLPALTLVLGGARSGKSRHAEALVRGHAEAIGVRPVYIATAEARDREMAARIAEHQTRRGDCWQTEEAPVALASAIASRAKDGHPILIDCLTLWLTNIMLAERDIDSDVSGLLNALDAATGPIVCVANEVGLGIVPDNELARAFRDHAGQLNQLIATHADRVDFIAAGLPITLKSPSAME